MSELLMHQFDDTNAPTPAPSPASALAHAFESEQDQSPAHQGQANRPERRPKSTTVEQVIQIARAMTDSKCAEVTALDLRGISQVQDFIIIATGTSDRQMRSVASELKEIARTNDTEVYRTSVDDQSTWIVIDCVDLVIHLFEPNTRAYYDLESMWGDAPAIAWRRPGDVEPAQAGEDVDGHDSEDQLETADENELEELDLRSTKLAPSVSEQRDADGQLASGRSARASSPAKKKAPAKSTAKKSAPKKAALKAAPKPAKNAGAKDTGSKKAGAKKVAKTNTSAVKKVTKKVAKSAAKKVTKKTSKKVASNAAAKASKKSTSKTTSARSRSAK